MVAIDVVRPFHKIQDSLLIKTLSELGTEVNSLISVKGICKLPTTGITLNHGNGVPGTTMRTGWCHACTALLTLDLEMICLFSPWSRTLTFCPKAPHRRTLVASLPGTVFDEVGYSIDLCPFQDAPIHLGLLSDIQGGAFECSGDFCPHTILSLACSLKG